MTNSKYRKKIFIDKDIPYAENLFRKLGEVQLISSDKLTSEKLIEADALIIRSVTTVNYSLLKHSKIKFIGTATAGIDHIDINYLLQSNINFVSAPGCNAIAVVEYVFSVLLYLSQCYGFNLCDKTIGIIGVGNIGKCLYNRLTTWGVNTLLYDPILEQSGVNNYSWQSLDKLILDADILTFHVPLTMDGTYPTWHQVNDEFLASLPDNRIIINTSRGAVIDNISLLKALKNGKKLHVILDVWESKSIIKPLLSHIDIGTAHIAGTTVESKIRGIVQLFNSYSNFINANAHENMISFLPLSNIKSIQLNHDLNEDILRKIVNLVYDIRQDDMLLRRVIHRLPMVFETLRKNYFQRREWSSLYVDIDHSYDKKKIAQLGFSIY